MLIRARSELRLSQAAFVPESGAPGLLVLHDAEVDVKQALELRESQLIVFQEQLTTLLEMPLFKEELQVTDCPLQLLLVEGLQCWFLDSTFLGLLADMVIWSGVVVAIHARLGVAVAALDAGGHELPGVSRLDDVQFWSVRLHSGGVHMRFFD